MTVLALQLSRNRLSPHFLSVRVSGVGSEISTDTHTVKCPMYEGGEQSECVDYLLRQNALFFFSGPKATNLGLTTRNEALRAMK